MTFYSVKGRDIMINDAGLKLHELLTRDDNSELLTNHELLKRTLEEKCSDQSWNQINLLVHAMKCGIIDELVLMRTDVSAFEQAAELAGRFSEKLAVGENISWWVVQAWAYALEITTIPADNPFIEEEIIPPADEVSLSEVSRVIEETEEIIQEVEEITEDVSGEEFLSGIENIDMVINSRPVASPVTEEKKYSNFLIPVLTPMVLMIILGLSLQYWPKSQFKVANSEPVITDKIVEKSIEKKVDFSHPKNIIDEIIKEKISNNNKGTEIEKKIINEKTDDEKIKAAEKSIIKNEIADTSKTPEKIELSTYNSIVSAGENFDLGSIKAKISFDDDSETSVVPVWEPNNKKIEIIDNIVSIPSRAKKIKLIASFEENGKKVSTNFWLTVKDKIEITENTVIDKNRKLDYILFTPRTIITEKDRINLNEIITTAYYLNNTRETVKPEWRLFRNSGRIKNNVYIPDSPISWLKAYYKENNIARSNKIKIIKKLTPEAKVSVRKKLDKIKTVKGTGVMVLKSEPQGATIYINEKKFSEKTNVTIKDFPAGKHSITMKMDNEKKSDDVVINPNKITRLNVNFAKKQVNNKFKKKFNPATEPEIANDVFSGNGVIRINSDYTDTRTYVDGHFAGIGNIVINNVKKGDRTILVKRVGNRFSRTINIGDHTVHSVNVNFRHNKIDVH